MRHWKGSSYSFQVLRVKFFYQKPNFPLYYNSNFKKLIFRFTLHWSRQSSVNHFVSQTFCHNILKKEKCPGYKSSGFWNFWQSIRTQKCLIIARIKIEAVLRNLNHSKGHGKKNAVLSCYKRVCQIWRRFDFFDLFFQAKNTCRQNLLIKNFFK